MRDSAISLNAVFQILMQTKFIAAGSRAAQCEYVLSIADISLALTINNIDSSQSF